MMLILSISGEIGDGLWQWAYHTNTHVFKTDGFPSLAPHVFFEDEHPHEGTCQYMS